MLLNFACLVYACMHHPFLMEEMAWSQFGLDPQHSPSGERIFYTIPKTKTTPILNTSTLFFKYWAEKSTIRGSKDHMKMANFINGPCGFIKLGTVGQSFWGWAGRLAQHCKFEFTWPHSSSVWWSIIFHIIYISYNFHLTILSFIMNTITLKKLYQNNENHRSRYSKI